MRRRKGSASEAAPVFDRTPPSSLEAERSVLGAILLNPDAMGSATEVFREAGADAFYAEAHQIIFNAMLALYRTGVPVDPVTVFEKLTRETMIDRVGGASYLADLTGAVPTSANIEHYAKIVLESALLRRVITTCTRLAGEAYRAEDGVEALLDMAEAEIFAIAEQRQVNPIHRVGDLLETGIERIEAQMRSQGGLTGLATGFQKLDQMLSGLQASDMIILAARPSVGKTAFSLNIASYVATKLNKGALVFSLEMSKEQLVQRLLCMEGQVDSARLRSGFLARAEFPKLQHAAQTLSTAPLYIDDTPNIGVMELRSKARRHVSHHSLSLIVIDYLQLMTTGARAENRQVEIAEISRSIKGLARELNVPVIALSQLSREAEKDDSGQPKLSHLRESGAIEQDADVVMMLSRPPAHEAEGNDNLIRLHIAKQRNGPTGAVELLFDKNIQRFRNLTGSAEAPEARASAAPDIEYEEAYEEDDAPF